MAKKTVTKKVEQEEAPITVPQLDVDVAVEKRLVALYTLQCVDTEIDKICLIRGELPHTIEDCKDEIAGKQTRIEKLEKEIKEKSLEIAMHENEKKVDLSEIKKFEEQQNNSARNNREFAALGREVDFKKTDIEYREKKIREATVCIEEKKKEIKKATEELEMLRADLVVREKELEDIVSETQKDEERLRAMSIEQEQYIEEYYLKAYKRLRKAARNGLGVVTIDRDACGGCFSKIPPQRQTEIKMHKKVIVCEHCGRILVDDDIANKAHENLKK